MEKKRDNLGIGWQDVDLSILIKADWNYKGEDQAKTEKLKANIKKNGQVENLLIREMPEGKYEVVNGNHRLDVMNDLKLKKAHVYNFGKISDNAAKRIAIETNETRFETDNLKLAGLIKELATDFTVEELETTMPFNAEEIDNFAKLTDFDWERYGKNTTVAELGDEKRIVLTVHKDQYASLVDELNETIKKYNAKLK